MKRQGVFAGLICLVLSMGGFAGADSLQLHPESPFFLEHGHYYTWGINWSVNEGERIVSASLLFEDISNRDFTTNDLYIQLLPQAATMPPVTVGYDPTDTSNFFMVLPDPGIELVHWSNLPHVPMSMTYDLDTTEVNILMQYALDGNFGIGFDPDCLYIPEMITLLAETRTVPIPGSVLLLASGLIGFMGVRRWWAISPRE